MAVTPGGQHEFHGLDLRPSTLFDHATSSYRDTFFQVKRFYFKRKYRECIALCTEALQERGEELDSIQRAIYYFYAGLSHDTQARNMSPSSHLVISTLGDAETFYHQAADTLSNLSQETPEQDIFEDALEHISPAFSRRDSVDTPASSMPSTPSTAGISTLEVRLGRSDDDRNSIASFHLSDKQPRPFRKTIDTLSLRRGLKSLQISSPDSIATTGRYNAHIALLQSTILRHLSSISRFRANLARESSRDFKSSSSHTGKQMTKEEKLERIRRGRERGWARARFDPNRYEKFAQTVLGELGT